MATTTLDPVFVDTNILIYSHLAASPFHGAAVAKIAGLRAAGHPLWISRQTLREYLAGMTKPGAITGTVPMAVLVADVTALATAYNVAEDGPAVTAELLTLLTSVSWAGNQIHDANIVATMRVHSIPRLLTNNTVHFKRFASHITVEPLVP
jgi:predicted nucleic acid-binding protein